MTLLRDTETPAQVEYQAVMFIGAGRESILSGNGGAGWELGDYFYLRSEEAYLMKAEILAVGTELLLGDILNTNAQFLAQELANLGIEVYYQTVVGDNPQRL